MLEHPKEYYRDIIVIERKQEINNVTLNSIFSATGTWQYILNVSLHMQKLT